MIFRIRHFSLFLMYKQFCHRMYIHISAILLFATQSINTQVIHHDNFQQMYQRFNRYDMYYSHSFHFVLWLSICRFMFSLQAQNPCQDFPDATIRKSRRSHDPTGSRQRDNKYDMTHVLFHVDTAVMLAAGGRSNEVPDQVRWQTSLPHLIRRTTERRTAATSQWIRDHVQPERRYLTLRGRASEGKRCGASASLPPSTIIICSQVIRRSAPSYTSG